jgi:hypothetical protein
LICSISGNIRPVIRSNIKCCIDIVCDLEQPHCTFSLCLHIKSPKYPSILGSKLSLYFSQEWVSVFCQPMELLRQAIDFSWETRGHLAFLSLYSLFPEALWLFTVPKWSHCVVLHGWHGVISWFVIVINCC